MPDFKLKINVGFANIELEGDGELVNKIFDDLKNNGLGELSKCFNNASPIINNSPIALLHDNLNNQETINSQEIANYDENSNQPQEYPTINNAIIKDLAKSEPEWVLLYCFYLSKFGEQLISKQSIKDIYEETGRKTTQRLKNFTNNLTSLVRNDCLTIHNTDEYILTPLGKQNAIDILNQTKSESKNTKKRKPRTIKQIEGIDLDLSTDEQKSLMNFYLGLQPKSNIDKVILLLYWLNKNKNDETIDKNKIVSLLRAVSEPYSFSIPDALQNAKKQNKYLIATGNKGEFMLSHIGISHIEQELLKDS